jgi:hypothetical protein
MSLLQTTPIVVLERQTSSEDMIAKFYESYLKMGKGEKERLSSEEL